MSSDFFTEGFEELHSGGGEQHHGSYGSGSLFLPPEHFLATCTRTITVAVTEHWVL